MTPTLEQITGDYGRKRCVSAILGATALGLAGAGMATSAISAHQAQEESDDAATKAAYAQKKAQERASEAARAAKSATPNQGHSLDAAAVQAATQHRRGVQSTFLASRMQGSEQKLGA